MLKATAEKSLAGIRKTQEDTTLAVSRYYKFYDTKLYSYQPAYIDRNYVYVYTRMTNRQRTDFRYYNTYIDIKFG